MDEEFKQLLKQTDELHNAVLKFARENVNELDMIDYQYIQNSASKIYEAFGQLEKVGVK